MSNVLMIACGLIWLLDWLWLASQRKQAAIERAKERIKDQQQPDLDDIHAELAPSFLVQVAQLVFSVLLLINIVNWIGIETFLVSIIAVIGVVWIFTRQLWRHQQAKIVANAAGFSVEETFIQTLRLDRIRLAKQTLSSTFWILLAILCLRSFVVDQYRIPSGSLKPTLLVGDLIAVNKFAYGVRLPIINMKIVPVSEPKIGDIMVFHWPVNPSIYFVKRVIGVPGDHINYINKQLYINGNPIAQTLVKDTIDSDEKGMVWPVAEKKEMLPNITHNIFIRPDEPAGNLKDIVVPPGYYFMMGDNRDDSNDSRYWGFVPEENIVGKPFVIWMSWRGIQQFDWDGIRNAIRWNRLFKRIH